MDRDKLIEIAKCYEELYREMASLIDDSMVVMTALVGSNYLQMPDNQKILFVGRSVNGWDRTPKEHSPKYLMEEFGRPDKIDVLAKDNRRSSVW